MEIKRYLVTSALPYANGPLHIGHLTGAYLPADIYVRFLRLTGKEVVWVCGSDEHGAAITVKARKENTTPQAIVDTYHELLKTTLDRIGISFDIYHRTSSLLHHETSQEFFRTLYKNGEFEEIESQQYYDETVGQFLADRYIMGTCPKCGNPNAYGDQCERCGSTLSPTDLINPVSTLSGSIPVMRPTTHWFLPLNRHQEWLREWIETGKLDGVIHHLPEEWKLHVLGQCKSWLDSGLEPRSMTRDLDWGIDVPQEIPGSKGKKLYVWLDAPIGYISATKEWAKQHDQDWEKYWKDPETALIHFIGKDNIVFHCLIFPVILKAHGITVETDSNHAAAAYNLPVNVPANQFMNLEGDKVSTSRNWAVWIHEYLDEWPGKEDLMRYYLIKNMPEQRDSEFTWKGFQDATNNELVNNLANFFNRVVVLINKYYEGKIPEFNPDKGFTGTEDPDFDSFHEVELLNIFDRIQDLNQSIREFKFRDALKSLMDLSSTGNAILQANEPWKKEKTDPELVKVVLNYCGQLAAALSVAIRPFMPFTSDKMRAQLNLPLLKDKNELNELLDALSEGEVLLKAGHQINEAIHIFSRIEQPLIDAQMDKLKRGKALTTPAVVKSVPLKETIQIDDFNKIDLRAGTILSAEKVAKADKLLHLQVDLGFEKRTIVSGIALHFDPAKLAGQRVVVVANLAPRKMKGIDSNGMILLSENEDGGLKFVEPTLEAENGSVVK
ncbi:MAG: methionine--tRNA ligase [Saprospiraceae bacterium]